MLLMGDELGRSQQRQQQRLLPGQPDQLVRLGERRPRPPRLRRQARAPCAGPIRSCAAGASCTAATATPTASATSRGSPRTAVRLTPGHWQEPGRRHLALLLAGAAAPDLGADGRPQHDATLLLLLNAAAEPAAFTLPALGNGTAWRALLDTAAARDDALLRGSVTVAARSLLLLAAEA